MARQSASMSVSKVSRRPSLVADVAAQISADIANGDAFEDKLAGIGQPRENASDILWNFEKFLVGTDGQVIARFRPGTEPESEEITSAVKAALPA